MLSCRWWLSYVLSLYTKHSISSKVPAMQSQSPSKPPGPLERFPLHIAQYLLEFVDRRSIFPFSLTSKFCCQAATPQRFARIKLIIRDKEKLIRDLEQLKSTLAVDNRFLHVRRINLEGFLLCGTDHIGPNGVYGSFLANDGWNEALHEDGDSENEDDLDLTRFAPNWPKFTPEWKQEQNEAWKPFADFLGQLPALRDLVYSCTHQIAPCVLAALHQHHPKSRLHMRAFSLRSLYQDKRSVHDIDSDEFAVMSSPCLYRIDMKYESDSWEGETSYNIDAIAWLATNSSSLRDIRLHYAVPCQTFALKMVQHIARPIFQGFLPGSHDDPNKLVDAGIPEKSRELPLETLVLRHGGYELGSFHRMGIWRRFRSFNDLRRLEVHPCISTDVEQLTSMAEDGELCSLRELTVKFKDEHNNLGSLLATLPHLETLKLGGELDDSTYLGISQGPRLALRKLRIYPKKGMYLTPSQVRKLIQWCPNLEDVRVRVKREQGGPNEVAMYRLLGRLPRLRRVVLQFACPTPPLHLSSAAMLDPSWDKFQDFRRALIDIAVDETLVRAIIRKITARKCPLERLKIELLPIPNCMNRYSTHAIPWADIAGFVGGRSWLCTRDGVERAQLEVREITELASPYREDTLDQLKQTVAEDTRRLWAEVWPPREGDSDKWWENWWSYPLFDDDGEEVTGSAGPSM